MKRGISLLIVAVLALLCATGVLLRSPLGGAEKGGIAGVLGVLATGCVAFGLHFIRQAAERGKVRVTLEHARRNQVTGQTPPSAIVRALNTGSLRAELDTFCVQRKRDKELKDIPSDAVLGCDNGKKTVLEPRGRASYQVKWNTINDLCLKGKRGDRQVRIVVRTTTGEEYRSNFIEIPPI
jgi:hypothetical protein